MKKFFRTLAVFAVGFVTCIVLTVMYGMHLQNEANQKQQDTTTPLHTNYHT